MAGRRETGAGGLAGREGDHARAKGEMRVGIIRAYPPRNAPTGFRIVAAGAAVAVSSCRAEDWNARLVAADVAIRGADWRLAARRANGARREAMTTESLILELEGRDKKEITTDIKKDGKGTRLMRLRQVGWSRVFKIVPQTILGRCATHKVRRHVTQGYTSINFVAPARLSTDMGIREP